jgi:hypothetical protein
MKMKRTLVGALVMAFGLGLSTYGDLLFLDTFNREDNADVNSGAAVDQSGNLAPLSYVKGDLGSASISGGKLLLDKGTDTRARMRLNYNLNGSVTDIVAAGGFEVSTSVTAGSLSTDWAGILLSADSNASNPTVNQFNSWHGLFVQIYGDGKVKVNANLTGGASNVEVLSGTASVFNVGVANAIRLVVNSEGFSTGASNSFSLYINNQLIGSEDIAFTYRANNNTYLGLHTENAATRFDDLQIQVIPEPATLGLFLISGVGCLLARRNLSL